MNPSELVAAYLQRVRTDDVADCNKVSQSPQEMGLSHADAERLIAFVPIAFAQVLLERSPNMMPVHQLTGMHSYTPGSIREGLI